MTKKPTSPLYAGHRGASYLAPENTLASQQLAWQLGAAGTECDILMTKDQQVIMFHDHDGKRLLQQVIAIADTNYAELKDYPIGFTKPTQEPKYKGQTIALLSDVLDILPADKLFVIEIKTGNEIVPALKKAIDGHWKQGKIAFIAFDWQVIIDMKALYPLVPCHFLADNRESLANRFDDIINSSLDGINLDYKIIDKPLVDQYLAHDKTTWCWTVNTLADALAMEAAGVQLITTDRPKWLLEQIRQYKKDSAKK